MSFSRPEMLYLLWLTPLFAALLLHGHRKRSRLLTSFASQATRFTLAPAVSPGRRALKAVLLLLAFPPLVLALAGVQYGYSWQTIERQGVSLMLALDCSKSMLATDVAPSRIERAKRKIHDLVGMLQGDKVGLVAFAGSAFQQCPLTLDYSGFDLFLGALKPEDMPMQGTDLAAAIKTALSGFDPKDGSERAILLITDGESPSRDGLKAALAAAEEAAAQKTRIFCVGVGSPEGAPVPDGKNGFKKDSAGNVVLSKLDEDTLHKIAALTNGAYVRSVAGDVDLDTIYKQHIRGGMEAKTLSAGRKQLFIDRFRWFVGAALALLLLDLLIPAAARPKPVKTNAPLGLLGLLALLGLCALTASPARAAANDQARDALAAYEKQDYDTALKHFLEAQTQNPDDPALAFDVGAAQYRLGKFDEARKNFLAALQALEKQGKGAPAEYAGLKPKALYNLGNAQFRLDQLPEAAKSYEHTLKLDPTDEDAKKNLELVKKRLQEKKEQKQPEQKQQNDQNQDKQQDQAEQKEQQEKKQDQQSAEKNEQQQNNKDNEQAQQQTQQGASDKNENQSGSEQKQDHARQSDQQSPQQQEQQQAQQEQPQEQQKFESSINASELEQQAADKDNKAEQGQAQAAASGEPKENQAGTASSMDQNILNRLKDRPGLAAMPKYQPRNVEKDW